jgi:hypothetical protein
VPNPDRGELILIAAGERIVAFARPGKATGNPVLTAYWLCVARNATITDSRGLSTVFKGLLRYPGGPKSIQSKKSKKEWPP